MTSSGEVGIGAERSWRGREFRPVARREESREDFMVVKGSVGVTRRRMVVRWDLKRRVCCEEEGFCCGLGEVSYGDNRNGGREVRGVHRSELTPCADIMMSKL